MARLVAARREMRRYFCVAAVVWVILLLCARLVLHWTVGPELEKLLADIGFCGVAFVFPILFARAFDRLVRKFGLTCPTCDKFVNEQHVVASGRCGVCGTALFEFEDATGLRIRHNLLTRTAYLARLPAPRLSGGISGVWLFFFLLVVLALILVDVWMEQYDPPTWIRASYCWFSLSCLVGYLGVLLWARRRRIRKLGLLCPSCGKHPDAQVVVATGRCGRCGAAILSVADAETPHANHPMMTREEYCDRLRIERRVGKVAGGVCAAGFFSLYFFAFLINRWVERHGSGAPVREVLAGVILGGYIVGLFLVLWLDNRCRRKLGLYCPVCGKRSPEPVVIATGKCGWCGATIFQS